MNDHFDPAARLEAFHAAINALDFAAIDASFAEDAEYLSGGTGNTYGRTAIMAAFRRYFETYPDQIARNDAVEVLGPRQARSHWSLEAHHAGTGALLRRQGWETITFDEDGRICRVLVEDETPL